MCDIPLPITASPMLARTGFALVTGFMLVWILGRFSIRSLARFCREPNYSDSPRLAKLHAAKDKTPTMGGLFLMAGVALTWGILADWSQPEVLIASGVALALSALGVADDWTKIRTGKKGLPWLVKLTAQSGIALAAAVSLTLTIDSAAPAAREIPFTSLEISPGIGFIPLAAVVIVASSNAVNLTDGLDGLACGSLTGCFACLAFVASCLVSPLGGETPILMASLAGGVLAFLCFNRHPAKVFLGDTGSLALGGLLGYGAILTRQELLLPILGGVFVAETSSVILQVASYKLRRKRIFLCAPLHHHFQMLGWHERKVVARFCLASCGCALLAVVLSLGAAARRETTNGSSAPAVAHHASAVADRNSEPAIRE